MSNAAVVQDENEDRYYTQVEAGDVRLFTLDQLDAAFNAGLIHENTYVCLEGDSTWQTLAEVAGLGDEEEEAPVSAPQLIAQPVPHAPHVPQAPQHNAYGYAVASAPSMPAPSAPSVAPYSVAPMVMTPSIRPVVNDLALDDDMDMLAMRPKRRIGKVLAGVAVLALGGLGFAVVQSGGIRLPKLGEGVSNASAASMSMSSLKQAETPKPQAAPAPEPSKPEPPKAEEVKPAEAAPADAEKADKKSSEDRFSEDMKAALLNKDKKQATTSKQKKAARTAVVAKHKPAGKSGKASGFKAGGSAYDPLNGKL